MIGRNVYGILRAGRSLGTESIILSVPLLEERGRNHHGIAVMLALAEYFQSIKILLCMIFRNFAHNIKFQTGHSLHHCCDTLCLPAKNYWAKDLIFLVTSHDEVGMQAWINGYMGTHSSGKRKKKKISSLLA